MKKLLFVYNPHAGKGAMKSKLSDVVEVFEQAGYLVTVHATKREKDATEVVAKNAPRYHRIVCSGGDGTLHEVMEGLMNLPEDKRCSCGYIPTGTVNDFATSMSIPKNILKAASIAVGDVMSTYDIGDMNHQYFNYIVAFGAFTAVSYETNQNVKNVLGKMAYILDGMKKLPSIKGYKVEVKCDGQVIAKEELVLGMVANSKSVGGFPLFRNQQLSLNDGLFEGVFVKNPRNPLELQAVINAFLTASANDQIIIVRGQEFELTCEDEPLSFTIDGEDGGEDKHVVICNHKEAVTYIKGEEKKKKRTSNRKDKENGNR